MRRECGRVLGEFVEGRGPGLCRYLYGRGRLGLGVRGIVAPLRSTRLILLALAANFVIAPALAYGLTSALPIDRPYEIGLLLLGGAAGAPFLPKLAELAKGDIAFSVGLMLLLIVGSVIFMPVVLPIMIPGLSAKPWPLLRPLLFTMLIPLAAGIFVKSRWEIWVTSRLRPLVGVVSNVSLLLTLVLLIGLNFTAMLGTFGSGAVAVGVVFVLLTLAIGHALGGPAPTTRSVLGLGTGQRNIAAALLIATENYADQPGVVVMLLVTTLAGLFPLLIAARWSARRAAVRVAKTDEVEAAGLVPARASANSEQGLEHGKPN